MNPQVDEKVYDLLEKLYLEVQGMKSEIIDIKGTMATKDDLKNFATKDDLKNFATKDDLKNFATKDDLRNFATKDDLKNLATREDVNMLAKELHTEIQNVYNEVVEFRHDLNTMEMLTTKNAYDIAKLKSLR